MDDNSLLEQAVLITLRHHYWRMREEWESTGNFLFKVFMHYEEQQLREMCAEEPD